MRIRNREEYELIPRPSAVINPKQPGCGYPNKNICGAVVAWKLIWSLYETYGIDRDEILEFSEAAAVATVGDVMDLQGRKQNYCKGGTEKASLIQEIKVFRH